MFIPINKFRHLLTPNLYKIVDALKEYKYETRIVGGAVRDLLTGRNPRDVDLATTALPDEIMYLLEKHDLKYTTRGIMHGTVKVVFSPEEEYEITTRDYSIHDKDQTLKIEHDPDWTADAKRRDFTINSLMIDLSGEVFDYVGGLDDLREKRIRMPGDAETRIMQNPNLIIRFFKALAYFPDPKIDRKLADVVKSNMDLIQDVDQGWMDKQIATFRKYPNGPKSEQLFRSWSKAELTESEGQWRYYADCVTHNNMDDECKQHLEDMIDTGREISYQTLISAVGRNTVAEIFSDYDWSSRPRGMTLKRDPHVSYYKGTYANIPCYYIVHSAIEHIFVPINARMPSAY